MDVKFPRGVIHLGLNWWSLIPDTSCKWWHSLRFNPRTHSFQYIQSWSFKQYQQPKPFFCRRRYSSLFFFLRHSSSIEISTMIVTIGSLFQQSFSIKRFQAFSPLKWSEISFVFSTFVSIYLICIPQTQFLLSVYLIVLACVGSPQYLSLLHVLRVNLVFYFTPEALSLHVILLCCKRHHSNLNTAATRGLGHRLLLFSWSASAQSQQANLWPFFNIYLTFINSSSGGYFATPFRWILLLAFVLWSWSQKFLFL